MPLQMGTGKYPEKMMTRMKIPTFTSGIRFYEPKNMGMSWINDDIDSRTSLTRRATRRQPRRQPSLAILTRDPNAGQHRIAD
jgi:hypothetical protein